MDRGSLTQAALYISFCYAAATELLLSPSQPHCVFIAYANVTCHWMPGKDSPSDTVYTFEANKTRFGRTCDSSFKHSFSCTRITQTHCSDNITSPYRQYSFRVVAHSSTANASSPTLCINAIDAVKLRRPVLSDLRPVEGKPGCLELQWHKPEVFALSPDLTCSGSVKYQLQYSTDDQPEAQTVEGYLGEHLQPLECEASLVRNRVRVRDLCCFRPSTQYTVRLRQRYRGSWSDWSHQLQSCTGMAAPITAPQLWRTLKPTDVPHQRQVTLLWKFPPKSETACASPWFNVSCRSERSHNALQTGSCQSVTDTSCELALPMERCSCFLTMSNSVGTSPPARVTLPAPTDTVLSTMEMLSVIALDDSKLEVRWLAVKHPLLTGFLIEWESASETANHDRHWERLRHNDSSMVITDLLPEVRYIVSVWPEFGSESGEAISTQTYTRQGVPSTGPRLKVQERSWSAVLLVWEPLPVEQQHGFITQYTLYCQREDNTTCGVHMVPGEKLHYHLTGLSGVYKIYMTAHTVAGEGQAGPPLWVTIEGGDSFRTILFCALPPLFTVVLLLIIIPWRQRIQQNIWPQVPNPALSSLTAWTSSSGHTKNKFYYEGEEQTSTCRLANTLYDESA